MKCARCGGLLVPRTIRTVEVDVCPGCSSTWFDAGEFESSGTRPTPTPTASVPGISAPAQEQVRDPRPGEPRDCPRCATPTLLFRTVDGHEHFGCRTCHGIFLTVEQLRALGASPLAGEASPAVKASGITDGFSAADAGVAVAEGLVEVVIAVVEGLFSGW